MPATTRRQSRQDLQVSSFSFRPPPPLPFLFWFRESDWFASFLVNASLVEWNANTQPNLAVGPAAARLLPANMITERFRTTDTPPPPQSQKCVQCGALCPLRLYFIFFRPSQSPDLRLSCSRFPHALSSSSITKYRLACSLCNILGSFSLSLSLCQYRSSLVLGFFNRRDVFSCFFSLPLSSLIRCCSVDRRLHGWRVDCSYIAKRNEGTGCPSL